MALVAMTVPAGAANPVTVAGKKYQVYEKVVLIEDTGFAEAIASGYTPVDPVIKALVDFTAP